MHIKDHSAAMKFFRTYDNVASKGKWKEFVDEMEFASMLQEPRTMAQEPRNMAHGGRIGFKDGTQLNNEVLLEYFKKHKGKKYSEIAKILDEAGYITKGGRTVTAEALEMRAIRGEMTGYGHSKFIETTKDLMKEATPQQLKDYRSGKISEELFRQRVLGKRGDIKRTGTEERKLQSKKYREEAKLPGFEERAKKLKEYRFKFREKEYFKKGMPPPAKNAKEELWRSLFTNGQDYKKGRRLKTLGKYSKYINRDKLFNAEILDTKTGKKITFKNLEKYINSKNTGKTYAEVIKPYDQKWFINETPGLRNEINSKLIKGWTKGSKDTFFEIQHNAGKATHPFDVSLSNERVNLKEFGVRNKFEKAWDKTKSISERKNLFKNYIDELPKGIVSQPSMVKRVRTFGEDVPLNQQLRQLKAEGVRLPQGTLKKAVKLEIFKKANIPCIKGVGGNCTTPEDFRKGFNQLVKEAADGKGSKAAISKLTNFTKSMRKLKGAATWTGYGLLAEAGFMVPFAVGDYAAGKSWKRILGNATDYGFGPIFGQSEQEEFEAALPEGSKAVEGEKVLELGERLEKLEKGRRPQGRIGMDKARIEKSRENVITGITDEFSENLQPFLGDTPFAKDQWHQGMWTQAHQDAADARAQIAKENFEREQKRNIALEEDFMAAQGGIASLMKKKW